MNNTTTQALVTALVRAIDINFTGVTVHEPHLPCIEITTNNDIGSIHLKIHTEANLDYGNIPIEFTISTSNTVPQMYTMIEEIRFSYLKGFGIHSLQILIDGEHADNIHWR